ncbi:hypothetical protein IBL26_17840 [Roseomonas aerophila]|uniref:Uncharacterized protein n=1 Tax=Teichococcus aerophilus TaxID=1224513 RepID=A0ABR7RQ36_9PROT|nr:hypothetical protein [Pseudoroseomonas aerophila]MBC9208716.1 hypothetical protein [Pseudoroseomonas aerophila]
MSRWGELFSGAGLGLLVGLLMGLSAASVVGSILAALAAAFAAFFGLVPNVGTGHGLRVGAFGLACAVGVLGGLTLRTGAIGLAPSIHADVAAWQAAGYPAEEARALVAFQRLGVRPKALEVGPRPNAGIVDPVLFSTVTDLCGRLNRLPPPEALNLLRDPTAGSVGNALATGLQASPEAARPETVRRAVAALCN